MADFGTKTGIAGTPIANVYDATPALTDRVPITGGRETAIQDIVDTAIALMDVDTGAMTEVLGRNVTSDRTLRTLAEFATDMAADDDAMDTIHAEMQAREVEAPVELTATDVDYYQVIDNLGVASLITPAISMDSMLAAPGVPAAIGATATVLQAGTGAQARTISDKFTDIVSAFDFMTTAEIADVRAGTLLLSCSAAIQAAIAAADVVLLPPGDYLVTSPIKLNTFNNGKTLIGAGVDATRLHRLITTAETIDSQSVAAVVYMHHGDHRLENLTVIGAATADYWTGPYVNTGVYVNSLYRGNIRKVRIVHTAIGLYGIQPWLCDFHQVHVYSCSVTSVDFSSALAKTSLNFQNCVLENVGNGYLLTYCFYSSMINCVADYVNYTITDNPYAFGWGNRDSANGVYHIKGGSVTLTGCGTEHSYGNGAVCLANGTVGINEDKTEVVLNSFAAITCHSKYVPAGGLGTGYAVGPIQCGNSVVSLVVNGGRFTWENTDAPVVAPLVAFNYDEAAHGRLNRAMVHVNGPIIPADQTMPFKGLGPIQRYCKNSFNMDDRYVIEIVGSGNLITIPFLSSSTITRHILHITAINNNANEYPVATEVKIELASSTSIYAATLSYWHPKNITGIASTGLGLRIHLTSGIVNPTLIIRPLISTGIELIDFNNYTIETI